VPPPYHGPMQASTGIRFAEMMAALSVATDFAMGQPVEHALASCVLAVRLGARAGLSTAELRDVYYQALLRYIGCNADTEGMAEAVGDEIALRTDVVGIDAGDRVAILKLALRHIRQGHPQASGFELMRTVVRGLATLGDLDVEVFPGHCEVAQRLGARLGFGAEFVRGLGQLYARWDGNGVPAVRGEAITPAVRCVVLAQDMVVLDRRQGPQAARAAATRRRATQYDPALADLFLRDAGTLLEEARRESRWETVLALEPGTPTELTEAQFDNACEVLADFADIKSSWTLDHSHRVARCAAQAAREVGLPPADCTLIRRAALLHDVGRVGVSAGIWGKRAALSESEREKMRLHAYYTQRVLARSPALARLSEVASSAHERMTGDGYFRGTSSASLEPAARILAAADVFAALTEERPHRAALKPDSAGHELQAEARAGRLDGRAVEAVLAGAGLAVAPVRRARPAGLSEREAEVLGLLARGNSNKQIARLLGVAPKTVDNQVQSIYAKAGVRTRAGATLFAMENGLLLAPGRLR
jgi:HD-GYP domain-containing protein (c-di-GMP phosphodiesterase class II)/DNA-binding CsgD family transcriptional regulator